MRLADAGARTINIVGAGEPTIDPTFTDIIEYISQLGLKVLVATNGIVIAKNDDVLSLLQEAEASVVIKVNSRDPELQDTLVCRRGYAELRDQAIELLFARGFNECKPTRLAFNTLVMKANYHEVFEIFKFCRSNNIAFISGDYMPTGRTYDSDFHGEAVLRAAALDSFQDLSKLYEPVTHQQREALRKKIAAFDEQEGLPVMDNPAYVSGLPCVQALGVQVDNEGGIWHCPARNKIIDDKLVQEKLSDLDEFKSFNHLWKSNPYIRTIIENHDGGCPYKQIALKDDRDSKECHEFKKHS